MDSTTIIYTAGKVGSSTIYETCKAHLSEPVYHVHYLTPGVVHEQIRGSETKNGEVYRHLQHSMSVLQDVLPECKRIKIINIIRDPVARTLSHYFSNSPMLNPKNQSPNKWNDDFEAWFVKAKFLAEANHLQILNWHMIEFKSVMGIDLTSSFDPDAGFSMITSGDVDILCFQCELLDEKKCKLLEKFFDTPINTLIRKNDTADQVFGKHYKRILKTISLDQDYLNFMYDSIYAKSFYTSKQINDFRNRWAIEARQGDGTHRHYWWKR